MRWSCWKWSTLKLNNPTKLKDRGSMALRNGRGFGGESLTIGGVKRDGTDASQRPDHADAGRSPPTPGMTEPLGLAVRLHERHPLES